MEQQNWFLFAGAVISGLAVIFGAFGAHALEGSLSSERLNTYEVAVRYQMYHGLALVFLALLQSTSDQLYLNYAAIGFTLGVIIFSGSLYLLVLTDTTWLGAITPIGGLCFIISWSIVAYSSLVS